MTDKDAFTERGHALEEKYFHERETELIAKLRRRTELADALGATDQDILATLEEVGVDRSMLSLLHLVPLIYVAWASGSVSEREREVLLDLFRAAGVEEGSADWDRAVAMLETRPSFERFDQALRILRVLSGVKTRPQGRIEPAQLVGYCKQVAAASRSLLGLGPKISADEQRALDYVETILTPEKIEAARQQLASHQTSED